MIRKSLDGTWKLYGPGKDPVSYPVTVPGSVLSALLDAGAIPDPCKGRNEYEVLPVLAGDHTFERDFEIGEEILRNPRIDLVFEGIDTVGTVCFNDQPVAEVDNMHRTWRFPVRSLIRTGTNRISVKLRSSVSASKEALLLSDPAKRHNAITTGALPLSQYLRKAHCMSGWDWGPKLPDMGIWRPVRLEAYGDCRIEDVRIRQDLHFRGSHCLPGTSRGEAAAVSVSFLARIPRIHRGSVYVEAVMYDPEGREIGHIPEIGADLLCSGSNSCGDSEKTGDTWQFHALFRIEEPLLWWPNGYGDHPLYEIRIRLVSRTPGETTYEEDTAVRRIGLRTLTVSAGSDKYGSEFAFTANGVKIFAMGADYIPEDCILSRISREQQKFLLDSCVRAHFNCIRVWGGGLYPDEEFMQMCDERGLIVWQDLMFACHIYDASESFLGSISAEIRDNLSRIRHHACLGLICGNNELESAWLSWDNFRAQSPSLRDDYTNMFENFIPEIVRECAPDTFFWPSSPSSGGGFDEPDSGDRGDVHYWEVWHGMKPFTEYRKYLFRFCSEFGFQSFPCIKTVRTFAEEEDLNIFSPVMESHQKNPSANGKIMTYLSANFRYPRSFEDLLYVSQILQGCAIEYGVEHWRRYRGRCMGTLYWQLNDIWPGASWSGIDHENRWKALHYMASRFYAPLTSALFTVKNTDAVAERITPGEPVVLCAMNESPKEHSYEAEVRVLTMDLEPVLSRKCSGVIPALSSADILSLDLPDELLQIPESVPDSLFGGTSTVQNFFLTDQEKGPSVAAPHISGDCLRRIPAPAAENCLIASTVRFDDGTVSESAETIVPYKHLALPKAGITAHVCESEDGSSFEILLQSDCFAAFAELDFDDADAVFSDNCFSMIRREPYRIILKKSDIRRGVFSDAADVERRLKIRSLRDTY